MTRSKSSKKAADKKQQAKPTKPKTQKKESISIFDRLENKKTIIGWLIAVLLLLGGIGGFFTDFFSPIKEWVSGKVNPSTHWECEQDKNIRGIIIPGIKDGIGSNNEMEFRFGFDNPMTLYRMMQKPDQSTCFFNHLPDLFKNSCSISYKIVDSRLLLSADIYDTEGHLAAQIKDNEFILNQDCVYTWNSDDYGFEVVDSNSDVIFSIDFNLPNILTVQGVFYDGEYFVVVPEPVGKANKDDLDKLMHYGSAVGVPKEQKDTLEKMKKSLKPIFEYFGKDWFGKRKVY